MNKKHLLVLILFAATAVGCKSKVDEAPKAQVSQPVAEKKTDSTKEKSAEEKKDDNTDTGKTREVPVNTKHSFIKFIGSKIAGDHYGGFTKWSGKAVISGKDKLDKLSFVVDMKSLYTENDELPVEDVDKMIQNDPNQKPTVPGRLTKHLMNEDFFHVDKIPTATFETTSIVPVEGKPNAYTVTGEMTLHGIKKTLTFPATIGLDGDGDEIEAKADFVINRYDFNIKHPGTQDSLIKQDFRLIINLDFPIEQAPEPKKVEQKAEPAVK